MVGLNEDEWIEEKHYIYETRHVQVNEPADPRNALYQTTVGVCVYRQWLFYDEQGRLLTTPLGREVIADWGFDV
jgi:hypothetical protein